mmetsp:Transcript_1754/g.6965  ORF Transcript_1754/g.6965 Transcript_1754/m.6965 type:complete len:245 (+) Transcript_1754:47-781(+)
MGGVVHHRVRRHRVRADALRLRQARHGAPGRAGAHTCHDKDHNRGGGTRGLQQPGAADGGRALRGGGGHQQHRRLGLLHAAHPRGAQDGSRGAVQADGARCGGVRISQQHAGRGDSDPHRPAVGSAHQARTGAALHPAELRVHPGRHVHTHRDVDQPGGVRTLRGALSRPTRDRHLRPEPIRRARDVLGARVHTVGVAVAAGRRRASQARRSSSSGGWAERCHGRAGGRRTRAPEQPRRGAHGG